jgi:hypothetical protein
MRGDRRQVFLVLMLLLMFLCLFFTHTPNPPLRTRSREHMGRSVSVLQSGPIFAHPQLSRRERDTYIVANRFFLDSFSNEECRKEGRSSARVQAYIPNTERGRTERQSHAFFPVPIWHTASGSRPVINTLSLWLRTQP